MNSDPIIIKKSILTFDAEVIDNCFTGQLNSHHYVKIKPLTKISIYTKNGEKVLSNRIIQIPYWIFQNNNLAIPKKATVIRVTGFYGANRQLNYYFQIEKYELKEDSI